MADKKISELYNIIGSAIANDDEFVVVDTSASETKAITAAELRTAIGSGDFTVTGNFLVGGVTTVSAEKAGIYFTGATNNGLTLSDTQASGDAVRFFANTSTQVGSISHTSSATAYNTSSDYRLKENVVDLTGATDRLKQIPVHRFNFIADPNATVDGFLAHEVQAIVPEAIHGTKDEVDADGNPVYQGIDQSKLVPLLVATIKELEARITALENQ